MMVLLFALQQNLTPLHKAAKKGDHNLILKMINIIRANDKPLPNIEQISEDHRIAQIKFQRDKSGHSDWDIVNKKTKVRSYKRGGADHIVSLVWMDFTTLCS